MAPRQHLNEGRSAPTAVPAPSRWWLVGYVAATFLAFPHPLRLSIFGEGAVLDLGLLVSWAVAPLLILGIEGLSQKRAVWAGFLATVAAHGLVLHFIYVVTVYYGHAPVAVGVIAPFALACYAGVLGALFAAAWVPLRAMGLGGPFTAALLWTALDYLRSFAFTGWPWATLGYAQHLNPGLLGIAQFTAVYGLSFATVLGGCGVAWLVRTRGRGPESRVGWAALAVVVLLHVAGFTLRIVPGQNDGMAETPLRVAAIQGNIEQGQKWDPENYRRTLDQYERLTRQAADQGAEIIVWPETAVPGVLEAQPRVAEWLERLALETGAVLLVGAVGADFDSGSGEIRRFYDSAFLFGPLAGKVERYDKTHLVPFGEYVPLRRMLGGLLGAVASGIATGDVTPGDEPRALDFERPAEIARAGAWTSVRLGTPICYELLFPDLVRKFVSDGGGMLLAITNDAWYGRTGAPYQFLAITTLRSAETGVFIVRAANTGVSAVIDSGGWVREQIPIFEPGILVADVPVRAVGPGDKPSAGTFYVRHGDVFAQSSCLLLLAMAFTAGVRRRRGSAAAGQV